MLERGFNLAADGLHLVRRKHRLLQALKGTKRAVVFDGASWTTPKLASLIESVSERVPVWLCVCSEHPWAVGRIWPLLVRFEHLELKPFHPDETLLLVEADVRAGSVPADTLNIVEWLHRHANGSPKILRQLLEEVAHGHYDLSNSFARRRLDLDRRIHEVFPDTEALGVQPGEPTMKAPVAKELSAATADFAFDAAFTTVGWLIPLALFRKPIEHMLFRKAHYEVEKNLSRLAVEWRDRVAVVIEDLRRQTESASQNELETLERMLEQVPSDVPRLREQIAQLESFVGNGRRAVVKV